ncbi:MAG: tRNA (adenosine(37)-N6)-dimethylallyltransferase MiaA [Arenicella sp.]|nr:tRNA (adenosine(37)-N6)-dimethylallyltransferase MiaA [Arenicella sp.]
MGTTATGKTDAAAFLAEKLNGEIISVDSSLVYRGMDIGTAKPDAAFLAAHPHHLVDIRHPNETYSVAEFYRDCTRLIETISKQGKLPILVGGTHFYFKALESGLSELPQADSQLRSQINAEAELIGWQALHRRLQELDPQRADRIDPQDTQRIQRALEIVMQSGRTVAQAGSSKMPPIANPMIKIVLAFSDRSYLHKRIEERFNTMLECGLQEEVISLLEHGVAADTPAMRMIGYRQMLEFLQGDTTYEQMRLGGVAATRQLAKRQLTWLRNQANVLWWVDFGLKQKKFEPLLSYVQQIVR